MGTHLIPLRSCCIWLGIQPKTQSPALLQTACTSTMRKKNEVKKKVITSLKFKSGEVLPWKIRLAFILLSCEVKTHSRASPCHDQKKPSLSLRKCFVFCSRESPVWFWFLCGGGCNVVQGSKLCNCTFITTVKTKLSKESIDLLVQVLGGADFLLFFRLDVLTISFVIIIVYLKVLSAHSGILNIWRMCLSYL